nr:calpain-type cysteine protease DEK1 [Tanacetum cinerariifolium]
MPKTDLVKKLNDDGLWEVYEQYDAKGLSLKLNEGEDLKEKIPSGDEETKSSSGSTYGIQKEYGVGVVYPKINPALCELVTSTYHGMPHEPSHVNDGESKTYLIGDGYIREAVAYLLDHSGTRARGALWLLEKFISNEGNCEVRDVIINHFSIDELHKNAMLDIRFTNVDRHLGNILRDSQQDGPCQLIPIEHGCCFPSSVQVPEKYTSGGLGDGSASVDPQHGVSFSRTTAGFRNYQSSHDSMMFYIGMRIIKTRGRRASYNIYLHESVGGTDYVNSREISCEMVLEPDPRGYTIVPTTIHPGEEAPFVLSVFTKSSITLEAL